MSILKTKKLCKYYESGENIVKAVDNIDLEIKAGEFVAIIGSSGSGKSTLLHMLGGVDNPTSGEVILEGKNIYSLADEEMSELRRKKINIIYQFYNLIPTLNVKENILLPTLLGNEKYDEKYLNELIKMLGLENRTNHIPNELSGGEQQRVSIGRSLLSKPLVLLADEPTGNLDSKNSIEIMKLLLEANKRYNQTIIIVTHDDKIAHYAQRVITIKDGKIIKDEMIKNESN